MSSNSPSPENDPRRSGRFIPPASGASNTPHPDGGLSAPAPGGAAELAKELSQCTPLEPWQQRLVLMRAAAFQASATSVLERAGDLILFPSDHCVFEDGQEENVDRYIQFRDEFRKLYNSLIDRYAWGIHQLPVALGGLNTKDVNVARLQGVFEGEIFGKMEALKQLCTEAVSLHKEVFDEALREERERNSGVPSGIKEGDLLDEDSVQEERAEEFQEWDCELRAISNICDWLSHYFSNPDEGLATCNLHDFLHDKARALTLEGDIDRSASITEKLSGLTTLLQHSAYLLDTARANALDEWRLDGRNGNPCSERELAMLREMIEAPIKLRVEEEKLSQGTLVSLEIHYPLAESLKPSYQKAFITLATYFDALRPFAKEQGIGIAIRKDRPSIVLYVFKDSPTGTGHITPMGPYVREDDDGYENSGGDDDKQKARQDPRVIEDHVLSLSPGHRRGIFIDFAHAALASEASFRNFQAVRKLIHDWADIERGFVEASLKAFSPGGSNDGAGLQQKWEANRYQLALTSTPENSPNFKLEETKHPLSRALPCDEERAAEERGHEPHLWGPTLSRDRTRRCLVVESGACNYPHVLKSVRDILQQAHPLFLSVSVRNHTSDNEAESYQVLAQELDELAGILRRVRSDYGCGKLYVAQLEPEREYPGFQDILAVYNIYHSGGSLVSRVYLQKTSDKTKPFELVERRLVGLDLQEAEKEVLTVLASCAEEFRFIHNDLRQHFADRHIFLCDTLLQEICAASDPFSDHDAESAVAKFFRGPSVWIEREKSDDEGARLYVFSQREREYR